MSHYIYATIIYKHFWLIFCDIEIKNTITAMLIEGINSPCPLRPCGTGNSLYDTEANGSIGL